MNLNKKLAGLILAITATLSGCGGPSASIEQLYYASDISHVKSVKTGDHIDVTIYNFIDKTIEIYTDNEHLNTISVDHNTDEKFQHHVDAYNRIFKEMVERYTCKDVYGCRAEAKIVEDKVQSFKTQITNLKQSANDLQQELKAAGEREAMLTASLSEAQNSNQVNASEIENLQAQLAQAQAQKSTVSESLAEYEALIRSTLSTEDEGDEE